ncbi:LCP family protein [Agromyces seonyuensis]|uniref:LytR family transcriptional regulator n=1 Tax=Agromyces seonyuensis TaxID=2662446 RepID=A0A6I4NS41_9MICO|nr:LCP family protein [Agromyces seonyuensis]MWB97298.1 LytR family transcriptional regulator [Agromyces seonyuensis]
MDESEPRDEVDVDVDGLLEPEGAVDEAGPVRHGRLTGQGMWRPALKWIASVTAILLVALAATVGFVIWDTVRSVQEDAVDLGGDAGELPELAGIGSIDGGFDLLLVGTDNDAEQGDAFGERDATLNDVNIWLHVADDHEDAVAVSFPRDLVIPHPECTDPDDGTVYPAMSAQPLNTAYGRGGLACVAATIGELTGVQMDYAASISFLGVIALSDAVGGVEVCVDEAISDPYSGLELPAGISTIEGADALAYLRTRHGVGDGSDLARISNQQAYLSSLVRKLQADDTFSDPATLFALARTAADHVEVSTSLADPITMASLALTLREVPLERIVFVQYPVLDSVDAPGKVVPNTELADELVAAIVADETFTLADGSLGYGVEAEATESPTDPTVEPATEGPATADPGATVPPTETGPPVLDGLTGQSADVATCARANG